MRFWIVALTGLFSLPGGAHAVRAQDAPLTVVHGRIESAETGAPVPGAFVVTADSSWSAVSDSTGEFALAFREPPYAVVIDAFGFPLSEFELAESAPGEISVLELYPEPIELAGIDVVAEAEITRVLDQIENRRDAYTGSVRAFDTDRIERTRARNAFDLVLQTVSGAQECESRYPLYAVSDRICGRVPNRAPTTFGNAGAQVGSGGDGRDLSAGADELLICVNDRRIYGHDGVLSSIPVEEIAYYEIFSAPMASVQPFVPPAGYVRIYTRIWMLTEAITMSTFRPASWGC